MSAVAETPFDAVSGDRLAKRNALVLATGQALAGANNSVIFATGGILGAMMAPDKSLATLPLSLMVCGMAAGSLPVGALAR
ncbi:MAG: MFS transporter, partial [Alphaproteobacteria bacterium]|nr:MFS transporter [Alphaproteobacteria bacterium]